tara:strand:- start:99 stop:2813 length:2715 start_codon:yes stop_codon:yes gene_type:complete
MKNKITKIFFYIIVSLFFSINLNSEELFNFNVSEIKISQDGNLFQGFGGGEAFTDNGISITAENFEYNKRDNNLIARNNVKFIDQNKKLIINADEISYNKKKEKIIAKGDVEIIDNINDTTIFASEIIYIENKQEIIAKNNIKLNDKLNNLIIVADDIYFSKNDEIIVAEKNVILEDLNKDIKIKSNKITFNKLKNLIFTEGKTTANIKSKFYFDSSNVKFLKKEMKLFSQNKTIIRAEDFSLYELNSFEYQIDKEFLKGKDLFVTENSNLKDGESDKYYFADGFFDLKNKTFKTGSAKIFLKKNIFDRSENDPRLYGVSSNHLNGITTVNKAVFTSCKKTGNCPPWSIEASKIKHDKNEKRLIYDNSILKLYDIPVFYFPKFFHPDPTVERQSGFLIPRLNNSNVLGSSISTPYFHVISENKDWTINPTIYSKDIRLIQNEYRQENKNSSLIADFGFTNGFKSSEVNERKNINHLFAEFKKKIESSNFIKSDLRIFVERVSKDTYLKIFSDNLNDNNVKPSNFDVLNSGIDFILENEEFSLSGGTDIYEDLRKTQSDRYQFVLPHYNYSQKTIKFNSGNLNFDSSGNSTLDNTNNHKARIINDISFKMNDKILNNIGLRNNLNFYFKNLNSVGKNVSTYKNSPQIEAQSMIELNSELPLSKITEFNNQTLIPRLSLRINPGDMKNHNTDKRKVNTDNIFDINRLGIEDSLESGYSFTAGFDFKSENKNDSGKFIQFKLASVFRDSVEDNIPTQTSLNKKNSNIFGSFDYGLSKYINMEYDFAVDNKIEGFKYNSVGLNLSLNNFITEFNFIEEDANLGNTNIFENTTKYNINSNNALTFKTRRNREINLTEYYNLIYEYKNDCLTAGIKFNKTYYEDRDLKPSENIMFTISFYPLTSIEQSLN